MAFSFLVPSNISPLTGINVVKRKLAAHDNLKLTITQEGNKFTVKESSTFRNIDIVFELGVSFTYSLADETELNVRLFSFFFFINNAFLIFFLPMQSALFSGSANANSFIY
ncbi:Fatty acid-binding protein, intestinal [Lemmus lemmus]